MKSDRNHRFKSVKQDDLGRVSKGDSAASSNNDNNNYGPMWSAMGVNNSDNPFLAKGYYYK